MDANSLADSALADLDGGVDAGVDVTAASFGELSRLDDDALGEAIDRLLRPCGGTGGRTWSNDEFRPEP